MKAGGNIVITSSDASDLDNIAGAAGLGFGGGVGVSVGVNVIHKDTRAFVGQDALLDAKSNSSPVSALAAVGSNSLTNATTQGVLVQASSSEALLNISAAGAAGFVGGAGSLSVNVIDSDTTAFVGDRTVLNADPTGANVNQSVRILAGNEVHARSISGGLAVGAGSFAGAGDIGVVRNDTTTFVGNDAKIHAKNDIVVHSLALEEVDSLGVSGGFAATGAFAAAASVWALGTKFDPNYSDDSTTTNALTNGNTTVDQQATSSAGTTRSAMLSSLNNYSGVASPPVLDPTPSQQIADRLRGSRQAVSDNFSTSSQLTAELFQPADATGTTTEVRSGAILDAGDDISVRADSNIDLFALSGSAAGAAAFAVGAAVTVERTQMKTDVLFSGIVDRADQVLIQAQSANDTVGRGLSANGAIGGALGAAVTSLKDSSATTARVDGNPTQHASFEQANQLQVKAQSTTNLDATTGQGSIAGIAAVGVTVTKAVAEGTTQALIEDHVDVGQVAGSSVNSLTLDAIATTSTKAQGIAIQAGVGGAGGLNFATADASPEVIASLGSRTSNSNIHIQVAGPVDVLSESKTSSDAQMLGLQLAVGASLGFSRALSTVAPDVEAAVGQGTDLTASGDIKIDAIHNRPVTITLPNGSSFTTERNAVAKAESGGGAAIAGNTARATSESKPNVGATLLNNASITTPSLLHVQAESNGNAIAIGGAITGGLVAAGGVQTTSTNQGASHVGAANGTVIHAGTVEIRSHAIDRGESVGTAATGGIVSGSAVTSNANLLPIQRTIRFGITEDTPNSSVDISGATIDAVGNITIQAIQEVDVDAFARGRSIGGAFTAGKSDANVTVKPLLDTKVATSQLQTAGNILIEARVGDLSNPSVTAMDISEEEAVRKDGISVAFGRDLAAL